MSAGAGYKYPLQSVAAGDGNRPLTTPLITYYAEKRTPPGYWLGTGVHGLGTNDQHIQPGETVTEDHLRRLPGQGREPLTNDPLGLPYFLHKTAEERIANRVAHLDPDLGDKITTCPTRGKEKSPFYGDFSYSGGGIRTRDLRVMSPRRGRRRRLRRRRGHPVVGWRGRRSRARGRG